jgi:hypothetical protein
VTWLTIQTIAWCLVGFAVGALAAWLLAVMLYPHENEVVASAGEPAAPTDEAGDDA